MHQHPRPSPYSASSATNMATNPERTNNPRDRLPQRNRSSVDLASYTDRGLGESPRDVARPDSTPISTQDRDVNRRLNQIIQVHQQNGEIKTNKWGCLAGFAFIRCKACHPSREASRDNPGWIRLTPNFPTPLYHAPVTSKLRLFADRILQFNILVDETDILLEDLSEWRRPDLSDRRPMPLVIEVYLDTSHLSHNHALVIEDDDGRQYDVADALGSSAESSPHPSRSGGRFCEVILERWTINLDDSDDYSVSDLNDALPNVYKKGVVLFRSLYTFTRLMPAWKLYKKVTRQAGSHQQLRIKFRIKQGHDRPRRRNDTLYAPLCPSEQEAGAAVERHRMEPLLCLSGPLCISVDYRTNCEFTVANAETSLSSRFAGYDQGSSAIPVGKSLPSAHSEQSNRHYNRLSGAPLEPQARVGGYGSLGTFHPLDRRGSVASDSMQRTPEGDMSSRASDLRSDALGRRPSIQLVSRPPFKGGSLASSPRPPPSPSPSLGKSDTFGQKVASAPARNSLNTVPPHTLRPPPVPNEVAAVSPESASPKPALGQRFSSSFGTRHRRLTSQGSKAGDSNASSGRASSSSKEKSAPFLEGTGTPGSAGSGGGTGLAGVGPKTDEEDIASFISQVENAKDLASFRNPSRPTSRDMNTVNLTKYRLSVDPMQLAEEMTSSSLIQASTTPPSRRLSNVPGLSLSSSPGRAITHAPYVRSRLSTHSIVEVPGVTTTSSGSGSASGGKRAGVGSGSQSGRGPGELGGEDVEQQDEEDEEEDEEPFIFAQDSL